MSEVVKSDDVAPDQRVQPTDLPWLIDGVPADEHLIQRLAKNCSALDVHMPTSDQIAAMLHSLADSVALRQATRWRHAAYSLPSDCVGLWLQDLGDLFSEGCR